MWEDESEELREEVMELVGEVMKDEVKGLKA